MMRALFLALICLLSLPRAQAAENALDLLDPPVSYSAEFTLNTDKGPYRGQVWHAPGRERRQYATRSGEQVLLVRRDLDAVYLLKPAARWYVAMNLGAALTLAGSEGALSVERRLLREERVGAQAASRYRVRVTGAEGRDFEGDAWFTPKGILVRADGASTGVDGRIRRIDTTLTRLRQGPVDPALFDIPQGWLGVDLRSVPAESIKGAMKGLKPLLGGN